jgi:hypothetical protein
METSRHKLQRAGSAAFALVAVVLVVLAILWPPVVAEMLRSRLGISLIAVWSVGFAFLLHPELSAGLARGIREFQKATRQVIREIRGDDDDDDSHAA